MILVIVGCHYTTCQIPGALQALLFLQIRLKQERNEWDSARSLKFIIRWGMLEHYLDLAFRSVVCRKTRTRIPEPHRMRERRFTILALQFPKCCPNMILTKAAHFLRNPSTCGPCRSSAAIVIRLPRKPRRPIP